jgi:hypothetical protein
LRNPFLLQFLSFISEQEGEAMSKGVVIVRTRKSYGVTHGAPENGDFSGLPPNGSIFTRRTFLRRSGGASAATMLALHGMKVEILAQGGSTGFWWVLGHPNNYEEAGPATFNGYTYKIKLDCTPRGGQPKAVEVKVEGEAWKTGSYGSTVITTPALSLSANIVSQTTGELGSSMSPPTGEVEFESPYVYDSIENYQTRQKMVVNLRGALTSGMQEATILGQATISIIREGRWLIPPGDDWEIVAGYPKTDSLDFEVSADSQFDPTD